jgi:hypothetical protein
LYLFYEKIIYLKIEKRERNILQKLTYVSGDTRFNKKPTTSAVTILSVIDAVLYRIQKMRDGAICVYFDGNTFMIRSRQNGFNNHDKSKCNHFDYLVGVYNKNTQLQWIQEDIINAFEECQTYASRGEGFY